MTSPTHPGHIFVYICMEHPTSSFYIAMQKVPYLPCLSLRYCRIMSINLRNNNRKYKLLTTVAGMCSREELWIKRPQPIVDTSCLVIFIFISMYNKLLVLPFAVRGPSCVLYTVFNTMVGTRYSRRRRCIAALGLSRSSHSCSDP